MEDMPKHRLLPFPGHEHFPATAPADPGHFQGFRTMSNTVVFITGALTGIGRAVAEAFAADGAKIAVSGRHPDKGAELVQHLKAKGASDAMFIKLDVRFDAEVGAAIDAIVAKWGQLDIAINNAGRPHLGPITAVSEQDYKDTYDTNVLGTLLSMKHEFRVMEEKKKGSIINISSIYGRTGFPHGASIYVSSKYAVEGATKAVALEGAPKGIRVNVIAPGNTQTPMFDTVSGGTDEVKAMIAGSIPQGRIGTVEEVAALIHFVAGDKAPYLTGESIAIDGGVLAG
jgi:NAD(P)-dependent dehydrogenase (short-subunit alcohol dehydrogenase family)